MKKTLFLLLFIANILSISLFANTNGEFFLLPKDKDLALKSIYKSIDLAQNKIDISIYSFTNKKIAKRLKRAAKRGVKIEIIFDDSQSKSKYGKSLIGYLAKYKNITTYKLQGLEAKSKRNRGIMHIKMALIDNKTSIFGSANWTYKAFSKNYETLFITKDYSIAKKFAKFFQLQKKRAKLYK